MANLTSLAPPGSGIVFSSLPHKGAIFNWQTEQQEAFDKLKQQLAQATALAYFDKEAPTEVIADASPVSLGAVLIQKQDGTN